ncbi:MAG: STAS domain-containing protein [Nitrosomonadales bacterium]|nr:STAS domain-containing protein [Nitrosomonadales bacterium]
METNVKIASNIATIEVRGRFDFSTHRNFREMYEHILQNPQIASIDVNLAGVDYMDSSALGMLLMLRERAQAAKKEVVLCKPNSTVAQILDIANFPKLFTIRN